MKPYIITYSIKEGDIERYQPLFDGIKSFPKWWHYLDNTWIVMTNKNAAEIWQKLRPLADKDINILIFELGTDRQGWLSNKAWDWIRSNIPRQ